MKKDDGLLEMAKQQGYVPKRCSLSGIIVMGEINAGGDPCHGCNNDRNQCNGRPKKEQK